MNTLLWIAAIPFIFIGVYLLGLLLFGGVISLKEGWDNMWKNKGDEIILTLIAAFVFVAILVFFT